jgi:hypothetical protein
MKLAVTALQSKRTILPLFYLGCSSVGKIGVQQASVQLYRAILAQVQHVTSMTGLTSLCIVRLAVMRGDLHVANSKRFMLHSVRCSSRR